MRADRARLLVLLDRLPRSAVRLEQFRREHDLAWHVLLPDQPRLVAFLGMLGSNHAGERAAAARFAIKFLYDNHLTWNALLPECEAEAEAQPLRWPPPAENVPLYTWDNMGFGPSMFRACLERYFYGWLAAAGDGAAYSIFKRRQMIDKIACEWAYSIGAFDISPSFANLETFVETTYGIKLAARVASDVRLNSAQRDDLFRSVAEILIARGAQ